VRLWPIDDLSVPRTPEELLAWIARQTSARIDAEGRPRSPE